MVYSTGAFALWGLSDFRFAILDFRLPTMSRTSNVKGHINGEIANGKSKIENS